MKRENRTLFLNKNGNTLINIANKEFNIKLYLKFAVDRCISWALLMLASPLFLLIAYGMWIEGLFYQNARGAVFYREKRISQGEPFPL